MDVWDHVLSAVGKRVNEQCYETWFRPIAFQSCDGRVLHVSVPNENFKTWLLANYSEVLREAAKEAASLPLEVQVTVERTSETKPTFPASYQPESDLSSPPLLHPKYTFETFVVGGSNQLAQAAAHAVAERPSKAYNPLYLYGGVGLGKTHLMHAIGHYIRQDNPRLKLLYMSSESFLVDLVASIRHNRTIEFRHKYRSIDVLLMDDIEFIAGKESTQREFFHTFNALYDNQKQIVITSDCPPKDIPTIEERLHSRFAWGLIADIQAPDLETKIAILKKIAEYESVVLPDAVALFVASSIRSNIRDLQGALTRLIARASLDGIDTTEIDIAYAKEVLKDIVRSGTELVSSEMVIQAVCDYFGLKPAQLKSRNNSRPVSQPRQVAMYLCKQLTCLSLPQIGKDFGGKHHTTVLHSIRKIEKLRKQDDEILTAINKIISSLG